MHPACIPVKLLLSQCEVQRTRRRGPGGQHRNKVETAIVITHIPTGVHAEASERRSQSENREQAILRLRMKLAVQVRQSEIADAPVGPSPLWLQRLVGDRIRVNPQHEDCPALLAEALDNLTAASMDVACAAQRLRVTTSQLVKFLKQQPEAWVQVNQQRSACGKSHLK